MPTARYLALLLTALAVGCAMAGPPAAQPTGGPTAGQAAPTGSQGPDATREWDQLVEAARREGRIAVIGPGGTDVHTVLTEPFQQKYGIEVEFFGASGREIAPRIAAERAAGQYLWDVVVHGTTTLLESLLPLGALDPIDPALALPEVKEGQYWRGGELEILGEGRNFVVMTPFTRGTLFVNPNQVRPDELKSYKDLLDPKWKGRIVMDDPRGAGPGFATMLFFYQHPELRPEFIRALARQEPVLLKDYRQEVDAVAQGRYPILLGAADFFVEPLLKQGVPIAIADPRQLREGADVSPANGNLATFNGAPHPNAAMLYVNWLLSSEGQTAFTRATGYVSARVDVPNDHAAPWRVPIPGAIKTYTRAALDLSAELAPMLQETYR
jgi:iron(III) transport system substrate-binding protein